MMADQFPNTISDGVRTEMRYSVEARLSGEAPANICGLLLAEKWRRVPSRSLDSDSHGYLGHSAAQALRWKLHADAEAQPGFAYIELQTRLVKHRLTTTYKIEALQEQERITTFDFERAPGARGDCMED